MGSYKELHGKNMVPTKDMSVVKEYVPVKNDIFL